MAEGDLSAVDDAPDSPPPLAALFLIRFDQKVGYTISWKKSLADVPLEGVVEYKSLPSGLHNVKQDLVYFVHEQWAGVSAFRNAEASEGERGAKFISVGALVRLGDGRLGRAWEHAGSLWELADRIVKEGDDTTSLQDFWEEHKAEDGDEEGADPASPYTVANRRNRILSSLTISAPKHKQRLPEYHPAYSILDYLDTFGPLAFALHRLALLRKRILIISAAPVRSACEYVYDLSILSSLPHSLDFTPSSHALERLRPLFNLGIHDIPYLKSLNRSPAKANGSTPEEPAPEDPPGWIATTTDEILAMKPDLYDILVEMPQPERSRPVAGPGRKPKSKSIGVQRLPILLLSHDRKEIKATQRDLRRYRSLRRALAPLSRLPEARRSIDQTQDEGEDDAEETHLLFNSSQQDSTPDSGEEELRHRQGEERVTEKASWSELAYEGFMWWASAGEREEGLKAEDERDAQLLGNLPEVVKREADRRGYHDDDEEEDAEREQRRADVEMSVIAYFHRVSKALFEATKEILCANDARDDEDAVDDGDEPSVAKFEGEDLRQCGLDVWSERDVEFVKDFVGLWFERDVEVRRLSVECCGVRIC